MATKMEFIVLVVGILNVMPVSLQECTIEPADVVFVLDTSYSIWPPDFYKEVEFMEKVINTFDVGPNPDQTRIGALTFGHEVWVKFYLNSYMEKTTMSRAIKNIQYGEGKTTNTGDALTFTRNVMFSERAGARLNSTKIVVVVSDGRSQKTWFTQSVAQSMQETGLHLFAVSVGFRLDHNELAGIASDPDDQYYFSIDKYSDMSYIKKTMEEKICSAIGDDVEPSNWNYTDNTQEFRAGKETVLILDCADKTSDIFFVIDASYSINPNNFAKEMEFIHNVVDVLDVGPNKTRVALMTFSDDAEFHIKLEHNVNKETFMTLSNTAKYVGGGTDTGNALRLLREEGFHGQEVEQRPEAAKIVIILTDGLSISPDTTAREAKFMKNNGIQIFSIGIGEGIDKQELIDMASEPTDKFLLHVDDFGALDNIKTTLAARACTVTSTDSGPWALAEEGKCHPTRETDLLFVFDALSLGSWKSQTISQFIEKSLSELNLATEMLRVGREIQNCPDGNIPMGGVLQSSEMGSVHFHSFTDMLKRVHRTKLAPENGGRDGAAKMVVLFVDPSQKMNYDTYLAVSTLKSSVDYLYVVGIGENMYTSRFARLAGEDNSIKVENYEELINMSDKLTEDLCEAFSLHS